MSAQIIDGKAISESIRQELTKEVAQLKARGITPGLAVIIVGDDPASQVYVGQKEKNCAEVGIYSEKYVLRADVSSAELLELIEKLNKSEKIHGILVQLPLSKHINEKVVLSAIKPIKDVDGFHPENVGKLLVGEETFLPGTPQGIMVLLEKTGVDLAGKEAVVVGRSNIVGKPISLMLLQKDATVTMCHSKTQDLASHTRKADVLIVAVGQPRLIKGDMVKDGAVVIDVGVNRVEGKLVGDVDFEAAREKASAITPVPGGVGPMTIAMLLKNTVKATKMQMTEDRRQMTEDR